MRRNKAVVLRAHPRERLIFIEFHSVRSDTFVPMPTIANLSRKKLSETAFRRGAHANNCNAEMLSCDTIKLNAKDLHAACVFESRTEYCAPN